MGRLQNKTLSTALFVLAFVLVFAAGPPLYVSTVLEDEDAFVALADDAMAHPDVRQAVADAAATVTIDVVTTDETITSNLPGQLRTLAVPATRLATAQLADGAFRLLDTDVAVDARTSALREVHRQFTADDSITIDLGAVLVRTSREIGGPAVGAAVAKLMVEQDAGTFTLAEPGSSEEALITVIQTIPAVAVLLSIGAILALIGAVLTAQNRRTALIAAGFVLASAAIASTVLVSIAATVAAGALSGGGPVGFAVAEIIIADYAQQQRGVVVNGFVLAAIGLLLGRSAAALALRALPGDLWFRRPESWQRIGAALGANPAASRLVGWAVAGFTLLSWSRPSWRVIATITILTGAYQALVWLSSSSSTAAARYRSLLGMDAPSRADATDGRLRTNLAAVLGVLLLFWPVWNSRVVTNFLLVGFLVQAVFELRPARAARAVEPSAESEPIGRGRLVLAGAAFSIVALGGTLATIGSTDRAEAATGCNGHADLCDRRIDEVVFAGSHNAMSANALGWELAMQDGDMVTQLDHGVRALLIDALYWQGEGQLDGDAGSAMATIEAALSDDQPRPGTWLCHGFCALGATDLTAGLAGINSWLSEHPREVLLIVVQDEVDFADLETAFETSGLRDRAFTHQPGTPFPTLRELIDSGQQILVYGENGGEPGTWFQNGYATTFAETPFTFDVRTDFTCQENRGSEDNPLFLINHWLTTGIPVREAASVVNRRDVLLERVAVCEAERGRQPTILAVDFVETGDLVSVVAELNGTG